MKRKGKKSREPSASLSFSFFIIMLLFIFDISFQLSYCVLFNKYQPLLSLSLFSFSSSNFYFSYSVHVNFLFLFFRLTSRVLDILLILPSLSDIGSKIMKSGTGYPITVIKRKRKADLLDWFSLFTLVDRIGIQEPERMKLISLLYLNNILFGLHFQYLIVNWQIQFDVPCKLYKISAHTTVTMSQVWC